MYYITITPILVSDYGNRIEFAPVQYELSDEWVGVEGLSFPRTDHNYIPEVHVSFPVLTSGLNYNRIGFKIDVSNENTPQAKLVESIETKKVTD